MAPKIKIGSRVLFMGRLAAVLLAPFESAGRALVPVGDGEAFKAREAAKVRVRELREEQAAETEKVRAAGGRSNTARWDEIRQEIEELDRYLQAHPVGRINLRLDLMEYWEAEDLWTVPGRILSAELRRRAREPRAAGGLGLSGELDERAALMMFAGKVGAVGTVGGIDKLLAQLAPEG